MAEQEVLIQDVVTRAKGEPDGKALTAPFIFRWVPKTVNYWQFKAADWRHVVAKAPIVGDCITTLIAQITALDWHLAGEDEKEVEYYTSILEHANGENFSTFLERIISDLLEVPFGAALEPIRYSDGLLFGLAHVDGATLFPTYQEELPYVQVNPVNPMDRVWFAPNELSRIMWEANPDIKNYGYSITPLMKVFPAIEALIRGDAFYAALLSDTPEAGILDLMDMDKESALEWVKSWQALMGGIDPYKVPVLYEHEKDAKFISFTRSPAELAMEERMKRYAEIAIAAFGMNIGDLGLYEHTNTKAGTAVSMKLSKKQGHGKIMNKISGILNQEIFPDSVKFHWDEIDEEDRLRKNTGNKARVETLKIMATVDPATGEPLIPLEIIRKQILADGLIDVVTTYEELEDAIEEMEEKLAEKAEQAKEEFEQQQMGEEEDIDDEVEKPIGNEERLLLEIQDRSVEEIKDLPEEDQEEIYDMAKEWSGFTETIVKKKLIRHLQGKHNQATHGGKGGDSSSNLLTGKITDIKSLSSDFTNEVYVGKIGNEQVIIKPKSGLTDEPMRVGIAPGGDLGRDMAAHIMDSHMGGIANTPDTVIRNTPKGTAMVQKYVGNSNTLSDMDVESYRVSKKPYSIPKNRVNDMALFDSVIGNLDRHQGNVLITKDKKVIGIDHGLAFPTSYRNPNSLSGMSIFTARNKDKLTKKHQDILNNLKNNEVSIRDSLKGTIPPKAIDLMFTRIGTLQTTGNYIDSDY